MGPITEELLDAIQEARNEGQEVIAITLYASAWGELHSEGSGLIRVEGDHRTFAGIRIQTTSLNPVRPRFVLETK